MIASEPMIKIVMLGEGRVGKTSLTLRYVKGQFDQNEISTTNADFLEKRIELGMGKGVQAAIWDTAGQEKFRALAPMYYRDASGAVLVYDLTFRESFSRVMNWVKELKMHSARQENEIQIVIAGNKSDLPPSQYQVSKEEAEEFAKKIGAVHLLVSARTGQNTNNIFETLARRILALQKDESGFMHEVRNERSPSKIRADQQKQKQLVEEDKKSGGCC